MHIMSRSYRDTFCSICGEAFGQSPNSQPATETPKEQLDQVSTRWACEAVLLSDPASELDLL